MPVADTIKPESPASTFPMVTTSVFQDEAGTFLQTSCKGRLLILRQGTMRIETHQILLPHSHRIIAKIVIRNGILYLFIYPLPDTRMGRDDNLGLPDYDTPEPETGIHASISAHKSANRYCLFIRHSFLLGTKVRLFDENSKHSLRFLLLMLKKNVFFLL